MRSLIGLFGIVASAALVSGSIYAFSGEKTLTNTNSSYFLVTLRPIKKPENNETQKPNIVKNSNTTTKDYSCQLNPDSIISDDPRSPQSNEQPQTVKNCQLIKVNFSSDKHAPIYWDELQKMKNGKPITQYEEFTKTNRSGYNNIDEWYILQVHNNNKSIFSNEKHENAWSVNGNDDQSTLFIYGEITNNSFAGKSKYAIAKFKGLSKTEGEATAKLTSLDNSENYKFACAFEEKDLTTTKNNCELFETHENNDINNIKFQDLKFPDFSKGKKLQDLKENDFYLIDMLTPTFITSTKNKLYVLDNSAADPNKKLATFEMQSMFLGNTSNMTTPEEIIILQQNKNSN